MNAIVQFTYEGKPYDPLQASVALRIFDFFQPESNMNVQQYSQAWKSAKCAHRLTIPADKFASAEQFMFCMQRDLNFHGVQVIGTEAICVASYSKESKQVEFILVHAKVPNPNSPVAVQIRVSTDRMLCQLFTRHFQSYLGM